MNYFELLSNDLIYQIFDKLSFKSSFEFNIFYNNNIIDKKFNKKYQEIKFIKDLITNESITAASANRILDISRLYVDSNKKIEGYKTLPINNQSSTLYNLINNIYMRVDHFTYKSIRNEDDLKFLITYQE